jgi:hypothetical protein
MHLRARSFVLVALLGGVSLGVAGCGNDRPSVEIGTPGSGGSGAGEPSGTGSGPSGTDGGVADCAEILKAYANLAVSALKGKDAAASARDTLNGLKSKLPSDLQGDLTVVADAFGNIAENGVVSGSAALTSSEFVEANKNILSYLRDDCLPG